MPSYTVRAVTESATGGEGDRTWTRQKLTLENQAGAQKDVSLFCNRFTPVPKVGDTLEGEITPNEKNPSWLPELKLPRKGGGFQGGPRPEDPKKQAGIRRMHSQTLALELVRLGLETALITKPRSFGELLEAFYTQVDELDADARKASDAA